MALPHVDLTFHSDRFEYDFKTIKCAYILDKDEKLIKLSEKAMHNGHVAVFCKSETR